MLPTMNVPKALLRRRRFLQRMVDEEREAPFDSDHMVAIVERLVQDNVLAEWRAEIKWLNYMLRETTGRGRVRQLGDEVIEPRPAWKTCPHSDFPPLVRINERENWCNDCQKYVWRGDV
jgi:hypothetical protein